MPTLSFTSASFISKVLIGLGAGGASSAALAVAVFAVTAVVTVGFVLTTQALANTFGAGNRSRNQTRTNLGGQSSIDTSTTIAHTWVVGERRTGGRVLWHDTTNEIDHHQVIIIGKDKHKGVGRFIWFEGARVELEQDPLDPNHYYPKDRARYWRVRTKGGAYLSYPELADGVDEPDDPTEFSHNISEVIPNFLAITPDDPIPPNTTQYPIVEFWVYFNADGKQGRQIRQIQKSTDALDWGEQHKVDGASYIFMHLMQAVGDEVTLGGVNLRFLNQPTISFQIQGLLYDMVQPNPNGPGLINVQEHFIQDPASALLWYWKERRQYPDSIIDYEFVERAMRKCQEQITLSDEDGYDVRYPESIIRYGCAAQITLGEDATAVEDELFAAMDGFDVNWGGIHLMHAGERHDSNVTITDDDLLGNLQVNTAPARDGRFNFVTTGIPQSNRGDFLTQRLELPTDAELMDMGVEKLQSDLNDYSFVTEPIQANSLATNVLRRATTPMTISCTVKPGDDWSRIAVRPGQVINLESESHGIGIDADDGTPAKWKEFLVSSSQVDVQNGWPVSFQLQQIHPELYDFDLKFVPIPAGGVEPILFPIDTAVFSGGAPFGNSSQGNGVAGEPTIEVGRITVKFTLENELPPNNRLELFVGNDTTIQVWEANDRGILTRSRSRPFNYITFAVPGSQSSPNEVSEFGGQGEIVWNGAVRGGGIPGNPSMIQLYYRITDSSNVSTDWQVFTLRRGTIT